MPDITSLRPIERRILAMQDDGHSVADIAGRFKRSPEHVQRMIEWTDIPRNGEPYKFTEALEARVAALRAEGHDHEEIGRRFNRSADNIRQIEALAHYRRAVELLRSDD